MTNEKFLIKASIIVADMLNIDVPIIKYVKNFEKATFGFINKDIPNVVFLDLDEMAKVARGNEMMNLSVLTLIHEMRHLWQLENGWNYEFHLEYEYRKSEIDADGYAKHHINNVITKVYAELDIA